jgi:transglutaminase-like putative cysteine protease
MYAGLIVLLLAYLLNHQELESFDSLIDHVVQDYKSASAKVIQAEVSWRSIEMVKRKNKSPKYFKELLHSEISPKTRNFAVSASTEYFSSQELYDQYGDVLRYLSLYRYLQENFSYVSDPLYHNYYSTAEETIDNGLAGDCDDWSVLVYASVQAIGGSARLIRIAGHIYPEVLVGSAAEFEYWLIQLLDELYQKDHPTAYYHHVDKQNNVWLSFDFGEYPGAYHHYADVEEIIY